MRTEEWIRAGSRVFDDVTDAVKTGDFHDLSYKVNQHIAEARTNINMQNQRPAPRKKHFLARPINRNKGFWAVAGGICGFVFSIPLCLIIIAFIISEGILSFDPMTAYGGLILLAPFALLTGCSAWLFMKGQKERYLARKFYEYGNVAGYAEYISIAELSGQTGDSPQTVLTNLRKMILEGMLDGARLDQSESTLILTEEAYRQYQLAEDGRRLRALSLMEQAKREEEETFAYGSDTAQLLKEGRDYMDRVRDMRQKIVSDDPMAAKIDRMMDITEKIFSHVKEEPESASGLRRFMEYYLPTTEKLISAYEKLDEQPEAGNNITQTKEEISDAMDTINNAFENLLDSMFQDVAWDVSSDISVMKTMLRQDGLVKEKV